MNRVICCRDKGCEVGALLHRLLSVVVTVVPCSVGGVFQIFSWPQGHRGSHSSISSILCSQRALVLAQQSGDSLSCLSELVMCRLQQSLFCYR